MTFIYGFWNLGHTSKVKFRRKVCKFVLQTYKVISDCIICYTPWPDATKMSTDTIAERYFLKSENISKLAVGKSNLSKFLIFPVMTVGNNATIYRDSSL